MRQMFSDFAQLGVQFCDPQEKENTCSQTYNSPAFSVGGKGRRYQVELGSFVSFHLGNRLLLRVSEAPRSCKPEFQRGGGYTENKNSRNIRRDPTESLLNTEACVQNTELH